jgi:hypothetical protein
MQPTQGVPPITIPKVETPQEKREAAPVPKPAGPPAAGSPQPGLLPPPRSDYQRPAPAAVLATPSYSVWGTYRPADAACPGPAGTVPIRHGTFGSPDLRLSRDYHLLDAFIKPISGEPEEKMIVREPALLPDRFFVQGEFLLWWARQAQIPPLATTAANQQLGFFGQPGTTNLIGPGGFGSQLREGFRIRAGAWLTDSVGVDGSFFFLGRRTDTQTLSSDQFPTLLRPIIAANFNSEFGELVAFPGLATGSLTVRQTSDLWGADLNLKKGLLCECDRQLSAFVGYRFLSLNESLTISEALTAGPNSPDPQGTQIQVQDRFDVKNQFHGAQLGLAGTRQWDRFTLDGRVSVALGDTHQVEDISGNQVRTRPGEAPQTFSGGLLAVGPNLGQFTTNRFSVVPELTLNAGYYLTRNVQVYAGYNFHYWSNVIRPGDQIDRTVDLTFVPNAPPVPPSGQNRPMPMFHQTGFWAQGIQFGVGVRW